MLARLMCATSLLALAACSDNTPTTTGSGTGTTGTNRTTTTTPPVTTTPPATTTTTAPPATTTTPGTTGTVTGTTPPVTGAGGVGVPSLASLQGTTYSAGPVSLLLRPDNTFEMRSTQGNQVVQGKYAYADGVLSFTAPQGDIGGATFPMQCRLTQTANGFQLTDSGGNCSYFRDLNFRR